MEHVDIDQPVCSCKHEEHLDYTPILGAQHQRLRQRISPFSSLLHIISVATQASPDVETKQPQNSVLLGTVVRIDMPGSENHGNIAVVTDASDKELNVFLRAQVKKFRREHVKVLGRLGNATASLSEKDQVDLTRTSVPCLIPAQN